MCNYAGQIVEARAGRDTGKLFYVLGTDRDTGRLLLADGKGRKAARPKAKKPGHVQSLTDPQRGFSHPVTRKLQQGETVSDRELRRALAAFKEETSLGKR